MRLPVIFAALVSTSVNVSVALDVNGWYPCGPTTKPRAGDGNGDVPEASFAVGDKPKFECAQVTMPLCHDGLCKSEPGESIPIFVRRLVATQASPSQSPMQQGAKKPKALWFVQGGPSMPSTGLEAPMFAAYKEFNSTVGIYTMDHRGTGRSHFLQCQAAQVDTDGSESSVGVTAAEMAACLRDLNFQYKNKAAAFSITSAATDLKKLLQGLLPDHDVFVQGLSYGTAVVQRLVQLQPPSVKGFIFEGVNALPTQDKTTQTQWSRADVLTLGPARRLLEACFDDLKCPLKFQSRATVVSDVLALFNKLDAEVETNLCSQLLLEDIYLKPSDNLRSLLGTLVGTGVLNNLVYLPLVLAKLKTCTPDDLNVIKPIVDALSDQTLSEASSTNKTTSTHHRFLIERRLQAASQLQTVDTLRDSNGLLYDLIVSSELYGPATPTPFIAETVEFTKTELTLYGVGGAYCRSTGSEDEICGRIENLTKTSPTFAYARDKYWGTSLTLPKNASALLLTGGLDFATPAEHGEILLKKLDGGRGKLLVNFKYGDHCRGEATRGSLTMSCHNAIIKQFVLAGGDVAKIDQSCLVSAPKVVFPAAYVPV